MPPFKAEFTRRGEGASSYSTRKAHFIGKRLATGKATGAAGGVSLIGQSAPFVAIALSLETAPEWCLADETKRR
jgi:hypothetical protein